MGSSKSFTKSFLQQEPLSEAAISAAVRAMRTGRLHRYDTTPGDPGETALLEVEFARYQGQRYCLACASCGYALYIAMLSAGVEPGDAVLVNAFTLAPVPGAIHNCSARAILVETTENLTIDLADLASKAQLHNARYLLLSHMRGNMADMDQVLEICENLGLTLIEDCAHTLGARWNGKLSGNFGAVSCFSTQTYKHLNSGEGGLLTTDRNDIIARAILHSGSYMLFDKHLSAPPLEDFDNVHFTTPNYSGRMDNLRAATLRPQLETLDDNCRRWNERYDLLAAGLSAIPGIRLPDRHPAEEYVGSSIQFLLPDFSAGRVERFVSDCAERGIRLKWFGADLPQGYTSRYDTWQYLEHTQELPQTRLVLEKLVDMRVPLTFDLDDCRLIVAIIADILSRA